MTIPSDPSSGGTSGNWLFKNKEHVKASAAASLVKLREMKPGMLSQELKEALGMPEGAPPPWLINMQRYGPPPSYPQLKIHGLYAPILHGALFGYHARGWGKPPVDELGRPLYGDVFGQQPEQPKYEEESEDKTKHWGDLEEEEEEEEEEKEVEELDEEEMEDGIQSVDSLSMCIAAKGDESAECEKFAKYYRSLCPCEWLIAHLYLLQTTTSVKEDVVHALGLIDCIIFRRSFNRPNLQ